MRTVHLCCCPDTAGRHRRRSKRSRGQRTAAAEAHPSRRAARGCRGGGAAASALGERAAAPPAIKRLLAHHGNRGVTEFRSVSLMVRTGRYDVTPHHFKRQVYLGSYETAEQAGRVADLAEVAAGKTGTRLNFEGEYGAEVERAAEVAAQPGMTDEGFKVRVARPRGCGVCRSAPRSPLTARLRCRLGCCRRTSTSRTSIVRVALDWPLKSWTASRAAYRHTSARWSTRTASVLDSTCQRIALRVHTTKSWCRRLV